MDRELGRQTEKDRHTGADMDRRAEPESETMTETERGDKRRQYPF